MASGQAKMVLFTRLHFPTSEGILKINFKINIYKVTYYLIFRWKCKLFSLIKMFTNIKNKFYNLLIFCK